MLIPSAKGSVSFCNVVSLYNREQKGSPHPNTFKCIVYLQTVLNGGPGVFLFLYSYIQRNYKEQAWLHFQNWAPLPRHNCLACNPHEEGSIVQWSWKLPAYTLWSWGVTQYLPSFSRLFIWRPYYLLQFKGMSDPSARCESNINQSKCSLWAHKSVRADPWFEAEQPNTALELKQEVTFHTEQRSFGNDLARTSVGHLWMPPQLSCNEPPGPYRSITLWGIHPSQFSTLEYISVVRLAIAPGD